MRVLVILLASFIVAQSPAQVALTPSTPALSPSPSFVPGSPALTPPDLNASAVATNTTVAALTGSLAILQTNIEQTLPILAAFNDSFDFIDLSGASAAVGTTNPSASGVVAPPTTVSQSAPAIPLTRDVLRALIVLQSDMQRMLPVLNALNGGTTNLTAGFSGNPLSPALR